MLVTNQTTQDYWFGPLHLMAGVDEQLTVDDTSDTSLYLTDDAGSDAIDNLYAQHRLGCAFRSGVLRGDHGRRSGR